MKKFFLFFAGILALQSCQDLFMGPDQGQIQLGFSGPDYLATKASSSEVPDTNDFILAVTDSKNSVVYEGQYGKAPESLMVDPGTYTISVRSLKFSAPKFSSPVYGDDQTVVVKEGEPASVTLLCHQVNSGVKLNIAPSFLTTYPEGVLFLKSEEGKLMYSYSEKRIAYFNPGNVSLVLSNSGKDEVLLSRRLQTQEVFNINISTSSNLAGALSQQSAGLRIQVDTSRNWISENYTIGEGNVSAAKDISNALSVTDAKKNIGATGVWVYGYIVGGDLSTSSMSFKAPFTSRTNIAIASKASVDSKASCLSVSLPNNDIRNTLNLVDHPSNIGRRVYLKGDIVEAYFKIPGIKNVTDCKIE